MSAVYGVEVNDRDALLRIADRWIPYRSVGSWYMYRNANAQQDKSSVRGKPRR